MKQLDFNDVNRRSNLLTIIPSFGVNLKRAGKEFYGCCPIHGEKTPSLAVNPEKGLWFCHGCHAGGAAIEFVRLMRDLPDTIEGKNEAANYINDNFLGGSVEAFAPDQSVNRLETLRRKNEAFQRGAETLQQIAFGADEKKKKEITKWIDEELVFNDLDPDGSLALIRAALVVYGTPDDVNSVEEIAPVPAQSLRPTDYSDLAQGRLFAAINYHRAVKTNEQGWLYYDGVKWSPSDDKIRLFVGELTDQQYNEASEEIRKAAEMTISAAKGAISKESAERAEKQSKKFMDFVVQRRNTKFISNTISEAAGILENSLRSFDANPDVLNCPDGTYNLRTGERKDHDPDDMLTVCTVCPPSNRGKEKWEAFIAAITEGDQDKAHFLKVACGMGIVGKVYDEKLIICDGTGGNGKSTLFGALTETLGDGYTATISPETLTKQSGRDKRFEKARLKGRRLVTAEETQYGDKLDEGMIKQLVSTGDISAEIKFRDPFDFRPTHHIYLQTNHLPEVDSIDDGVWDRLVVIPFTARFRDTSGEKKNYAHELAEDCGDYIVQWLMDGAREFLEAGKLPPLPESVRTMTEDYRDRYDLLFRWKIDHCEFGNYQESFEELFADFKKFREENGYPGEVGSINFSKKLEAAGYLKTTVKRKVFYRGIRLKKI